MKIGIAQINTIVGDIGGNGKKILDAYKQLSLDGADLVVFSELTIPAYSPRDLLLRPRFIEDCRSELDKIAGSIEKVPAIIGFPHLVEKDSKKVLFNAAAWCQDGEVLHIAHKSLLPTYDIFDEDRYFEGAPGPLTVEFNKLKIGLTICEDIWTGDFLQKGQSYETDPVELLAKENLDLLINISASPWHFSKDEIRIDLIKTAARRCGCPVVYCNQVGAHDEIIFDGQSLVVNEKSELIAQLPGFRESLSVVDLRAPRIEEVKGEDSSTKNIYDALTLGLRDYVSKCGFKKVLLGISGGIDSAVVACIAVNALGAENVAGYSLPSAISSEHSKSDAQGIAVNLGISLTTIPIRGVVESIESTLSPIFKGLARDFTEENIQSRTRGVLLMAISNKTGALLLTTGNKSELAVGYCTIYGDMTGGLGVISDLTKNQVYKLANYINRKREIIPINTISKEPSAELSPGQVDSDNLPPYEILDPIVCAYIEEKLSPEAIIQKGFDRATVKTIIRRIDLNEYKRRQAAPGLKITPLAFGVGRRMPIAQKYTHS